FWSEQSRAWIVTGHAEVMEGFSGTLPLLNGKMESLLQRILPGNELLRRIPNAYRVMPRILPNLDGAQHQKLRKLYVKALTRNLVEGLRPYVKERISAVLDGVEGQPVIEFHESVSRQIPGAVILKLLGMPESFLDRLKWWTDGTTRALVAFDPPPELLDGLEAVIVDMIKTFTPLIEARRAKPENDFLSALVHASDAGVTLDIDDIMGALNLTVVAGHDTTTNSMTLGMRALARDPAAWDYLYQHPERHLDCAVELMRYVAMSTAQPRIAGKDFDWRGHHVRENDVVMLMIAGGNRDPRVFAEPERLDFTRQTDQALVFAPGIHHCVGHMLAKLQVSELLTAMAQRYERIELLEEPTWVPNLIFRTVNGLKVRLHRRKH
ncbi:MAG: cytochrome P450, partial [Steroidobacteraceae bacterium]